MHAEPARHLERVLGVDPHAFDQERGERAPQWPLGSLGLDGEFKLDELPPGLRGEVSIEITFSIDTDGIVHVIARNPESGKSEEIHIEATARMDETEVMRLAGDQ
jgi:molecular chaperone DnaK (HSP70)